MANGDYIDRDELAEQRERYGVEYDEYEYDDGRNDADNYDSEGRYFGKDEPFDPSGADPDEDASYSDQDDGFTTDDWEPLQPVVRFVRGPEPPAMTDL